MRDKAGVTRARRTNGRLYGRTRRLRALHNKARNLEEKWAQSRPISAAAPAPHTNARI